MHPEKKEVKINFHPDWPTKQLMKCDIVFGQEYIFLMVGQEYVTHIY